MTDDIIPEELYRKSISWFFGWIKFYVVLEDRKTKDPTRRYKHQFGLSVFAWNFHGIIRSSTPGIYLCEGDDVLMNIIDKE